MIPQSEAQESAELRESWTGLLIGRTIDALLLGPEVRGFPVTGLCSLFSWKNMQKNKAFFFSVSIYKTFSV